MNNPTNPKDINPSNSGIKIKISGKGMLVSAVRSVFDLAKGTISASTITEWTKAIGIETPKEKQAFDLILNAIMKGLRWQLKTQIDQVDLDENKNLVYYSKELQFDTFSKLGENEVILNCNHFSNPQALDFLDDFKPYYKEWLLRSFPISEDTANYMTANFPDYFANGFFACLKDNKLKYSNLLEWCQDPLTEEWATAVARNEYKNYLKSLYIQPALGQENVSLPDVYIEPSFLIFDKTYPEHKRKEERVQFEIESNQHFLPTKFDGSLHDYILNHFNFDFCQQHARKPLLSI